MNYLIKKAINISVFIFSFCPLFVLSDDTEIYLGSQIDREKSLANIIFIMDTSGSMGEYSQGKTRLQWVQEVASEVIEESAADSNKDFNIALMSFNGSNGAQVDMPMTRLAQATNSFRTTMNSYTANGSTPITESLDEALRYLRGDTPLYGSGSISSSKENGSYKSPITNECQTNHIVLFSDGEPTSDTSSNSAIGTAFQALNHPRKATLINDNSVDQCLFLQKMTQWFQLNTNNPPPSIVQGGITYTFDYSFNYRWHAYTYLIPGTSNNSGECAEELALLSQTTDLVPGAKIPGMQTAVFHTVGGFAGSDALDKLKNIAKYGTPLNDDGTDQFKNNGPANTPLNYYAAANASELKNQLSTLFGGIIKNDSTFTAPAISVNAYNRLQHKNELYYSVFSPEKNTNWKGNLKRYRLGETAIFDSKGNNAVNPLTGFFSETSHSYWTDPDGDPDGKAVDLGGISSRFALPPDNKNVKDGRVVTTYLGESSLTAASNRIHPENDKLTNSLLKLDPLTDNLERKKIIAWASGIDVNNEDQGQVVGSSTDEFKDPRPFMEDPLHSHPVIVNYSPDDSVVFISTNSGYLHAISPELDDPKELFSFIPKELLKNIEPYYSGSEGKEYGLDGPISFYHKDINKNGTVESGDHIHLYTSMRRGGRNYYALDVSDPTSPSFLWQITGGAGDFEKLGQSWSKMIPAKVKWDNEEKDVLFFGGGYDRDIEDCEGSGSTLNCGAGSLTRQQTTMGNAIYMVDAATGEYLWSASNKDADLNLTEMTNSIVSNLVVMDTKSDGLADLIYATDTGGRIWRIDVDNSHSEDMKAYGGLIADLNESSSNNVRFYNTLDVAYIDDKKSAALPHFQLSIGSGYRAHPLDKTTRDRFYIINDFNVTNKPFEISSNKWSDFHETIKESHLVNAQAVNESFSSTEDSTKPKGIYYILPNSGEKVLAPSLTADNKIFFTTYRPNDGVSSTSCEPNVGFAKLYTLTPKYGDMGSNPTKDTVTVTGDSLGQTGIPPQPVLVFPPAPPGNTDPSPKPGDPPPPKMDCSGSPIIIVGAEIVDSGINCPSKMSKTYWKMN